MAKTRTMKVRPARSLPTTQARTKLPSIVKELAETPRPARRLTDNAIEVGPHNRGGVWIVPAVDAEASMEREDELRDRIEELDDELENVAIGLFLMDRMASSSGKTMSADEFIARAEKLAADSDR